jgi:glycosyltransferase involved in cell wall biosynthesis
MENPCESVTVLLAMHNGAIWWTDLITGLERQTYGNWCVIALDDASTDSSSKLLAEIPKGMSTQVLRSDTRRGAIATFERLLTMVDTEYFALCDQDDVWLPDKLEKSVRLLESTGADLVYTDLQVVGEDLHELAPSMWRMSNIVPVSGHAVIPLIIKNSVTGCTVVGRTSLLKNALPFPPGIPMHDWWLGMVAACGKGIAPLREPTVLYRQHSGNEMGAAELSLATFRRRQSRAGGSLRDYLDARVRCRRVMVDALRTRGPNTQVSFLSWFYRQSSLLRFLLNPVYLAYTTTHASVLGFRNLVVDWVLTCAPIAVRSPRRST